MNCETQMKKIKLIVYILIIKHAEIKKKDNSKLKKLYYPNCHISQNSIRVRVKILIKQSVNDKHNLLVSFRSSYNYFIFFILYRDSSEEDLIRKSRIGVYRIWNSFNFCSNSWIKRYLVKDEESCTQANSMIDEHRILGCWEKYRGDFNFWLINQQWCDSIAN